MHTTLETRELRRTLPRYAIERTLDRGRGGTVSRARDLLSLRTIQLRELPPVVEVRWQRFLARGAELRWPQHPGIARLLDHGGSAGAPFLAHEWEPYAIRLDALRGPRDPEREPLLLAALIGLAEALAALHASGITHGLATPDHLQVTAAGGEFGHAWITDLGLAELLELPPSRSRFLAPEHRTGSEATPAGDVFGLGATVLAALGRSGSRDLLAILDGMVALDPRDRPSAGEVAASARALRATRPVRGREPILSAPNRRWFSPHLIGREADRGTLEDGIERAGRGEMHAIEIVGELGGGKSRLLAAALAGAQVQGWVTVRVEPEVHVATPNSGPGTPDRSTDPLVRLERAIAAALGGHAAVERHRQTDLALDPHRPGEPPATPSDAARWAAFSTRVLDLVSRSGGRLILALDPAAGLSPDVLAAIRYLAAESGPHPVLVMAAAAEPLDLPDARRIELGPLSNRELAQLVAPLLALTTQPGPLAAELGRAAQGNPLRAWLALTAWWASGALRQEGEGIAFDAGRAATIPSSLVAALDQAVAELAPDGRAFAEMLSIWGGPLPEEIGAMLTPEAAPALSLVPTWLVERDARGLLRFAGEGVRDAILANLPAERRAAIHRRLFELSRTLDLNPAVRADHALGAGLAAEGARTELLEARSVAATGAQNSALAHYRRALAAARNAPGTIDTTQAGREAARLAIELGEWLAASEALAHVDVPKEPIPETALPEVIDDLLMRAEVARERRLADDARTTYEHARALAERLPPATQSLTRARIDLEDAANDYHTGLARDGEAKVRRALPELVAAGRNDLVAVAWNRLAVLASLAGDARAALGLSLVAARIARASGAPAITARALVNGAFLASMLGRRAMALRLLDRGGRALERAPHEGLLVSKHVHHAEVLAASGDMHGAEALLLEARRIRLRSGGRSRLPAVLIALGNVRVQTGRLRAAAADFEEAARLAEELETPEVHHARASLGLVLIHEGEWKEAERLIRLGLLDPHPGRQGLGFLNLATVLRLSGRLSEAAGALHEAGTRLAEPPGARQRVQIEWARLKLAAGSPEEARLELAGFDGVAPAERGIEAELELARGLTAAALGEDPRPAFVRAVAAAEAAGDPTQLGQVLSEVLDSAFGTGMDAPICELWVARLEQAAARTDSRLITQVLRSFQRNRRRETRTPVTKPPEVRTYRAAVREFDRGIFRAALKRTEGRVPEAARLLGLPESTFRYRAAKAGVLRAKTPGPPAEGR